MQLQTTTILAVIAFTSVAMAIDLRKRRIPNWLTVSSACAGLGWNAMTDGWSGLSLSLAGFGTGFGILLLLWLIGGGGGGDVKLMGAIGAWLGALPTLIVFLASAGFAVLCAAVMVLWNMYRNRETSSAETAQESPSVMQQSVPYALPVALSIWTLLIFQAARL